MLLTEPPLNTTYDTYEISSRREDDVNEVLAGTADATDETFTVEGLNPDTNYTFYVRTVSGTGVSRGISEPSEAKGGTCEYIGVHSHYCTIRHSHYHFVHKSFVRNVLCETFCAKCSVRNVLYGIHLHFVQSGG